MDDALNVHSTSLGIMAKPSANVVRCRYMHPQSVGLDVFAPGDRIRFIAGETLEHGWIGTVRSVETLDARDVVLTLTEPISAQSIPRSATSRRRNAATIGMSSSRTTTSRPLTCRFSMR